MERREEWAGFMVKWAKAAGPKISRASESVAFAFVTSVAP